MKRHRPDAADTINKALLARKIACRNRLHSHHKASYWNLRSPYFKMRAYMCKMCGNPVHDRVPGPRDIIWSCAGAFIGIFILAQIGAMLFSDDQILLLGSFGASSLIIFGAPHSNFAQPRNVIGGQIISASAGTLAYALAGDQLMLAAPLSVSLAFGLMQATATIHPPGGATALIAGSGQQIAIEMGILYPLVPVGAGVTLLFFLGVLFNNLSRNRQYPLRWL